MRQTVLAVAALLFGVGVLIAGNGLLGILLAVRASNEAFPAEIIGVVMSAYFVGLVAGSVYCVRLVDRVGHIRTFAGLASIASASALACALIINPIAWGILRGVVGFCLAGIYMVTESWLNDQATSDTRGRILSLYMVVSLGALAAGQLLLPMGDPAQFDLFAVSAILLSLGLVPVVLARAQAPAPAPFRGMAVLRLYQISPLGIAACFFSGLALGAFWGMGPVYAGKVGLDAQGIAWFMAAMIAGGLLMQWPVGMLSDRIDRRSVMLGLCLLAAIASIATASLTDVATPYLMPLAVVFGGLTYPIYTIGVAHVNDHIERRDFVPASSSLLLVYGTGAALGPILAGLVMGRVGAAGFFLYLGGIMAALALLTMHRMHIGPALPAGDKGPAVILPRTTPMVIELDSRTNSMHNDSER